MHSTPQGGRTLRLAALYDAELARLFGVKLARYVAFLVVALALARLIAKADAALVAVDALTWLSWWVGGLVTWSAAKNWRSFQVPVLALARECGVPASEQRWAAPLALGRRLALSLGMPGVALGALSFALSPDLAHAAARALLVLGTLLYVVALSTGLAGLTQMCSKLSHAQVTSWLCVVLAGPEVLQQLWPATPSVLDTYAWLLKRVADLGGVA